MNFRTGLLLYSLRYLCLLKFNPKDKCDFMLIYFILLGEEVGGGGDEGLPSLKKPPDPGGAQKCFIRGGSGLALLFTISNRKGTPF